LVAGRGPSEPGAGVASTLRRYTAQGRRGATARDGNDGKHRKHGAAHIWEQETVVVLHLAMGSAVACMRGRRRDESSLLPDDVRNV
jgi:hypothetical protein